MTDLIIWHRTAMKNLTSKKSRGKDIVEADVEASQDGKVIDIMEVLKKSMAAKR